MFSLLAINRQTFLAFPRSISVPTNMSRRAGPHTPLANWLAMTSFCLTLTCAARAQPASPPSIANDMAGEPDTNPPAIAGSLAAMAGTVSFHAAGETQWSPATLNYPVTNGEGFWTEPQASATIDIADDRLVLDESTELDVTTLDQSQFAATVAQGAVFVQLTTVQQGQTLAISTPRGTVEITQAGQYEIVAGDTNDATTITVVSGAAHVSATNLTLDVGPNQTATITGAGMLQGSVGPFQEDAFLQAQLAQPATQQAIANLPDECRAMTGGQQLASYGHFAQSAHYGPVWYPSEVPADWAPYRDGHWAYVAPWGWTWVDNARWGFAPFHYGRWAQIDGRWGWLPGGGAPYVGGTYPIYSPALVAFVGIGGATLGFGGGEWAAGGYAPAWVPLGPREPYYPWYHARAGYFADINRFYGVPRTLIERGPTYYNTVNFSQTNIFVNRGAATVVPASVFTRGQSVRAVAHAVPARAFAEARPLAGRLPVMPTAFTPNLPPEAARRFNLPPVAVRPLHVAAGPKIIPHAPGAHATPELRHVSLPPNVHPAPAALHQGGSGQNHLPQPPVRPDEQPRPAGAAPSSGHALPALRAPGARPESFAHTSPRPAEGARAAPDARHEPEAIPSATERRPAERGPGARHDTREPLPAQASPSTGHEHAPRSERPEAAKPLQHPPQRPEHLHSEAARPTVHEEEHIAPRQAFRPPPHVQAPHLEPRPESTPHPAAPSPVRTNEKHSPHQ
jgi:hypothetical protein